MIRTRTFQHGRFNYSIKYHQFQMPLTDVETGESKLTLCHCEEVKYYEFPFTFGKELQCGICENTGDYYRQ